MCNLFWTPADTFRNTCTLKHIIRRSIGASAGITHRRKEGTLVLLFSSPSVQRCLNVVATFIVEAFFGSLVVSFPVPPRRLFLFETNFVLPSRKIYSCFEVIVFTHRIHRRHRSTGLRFDQLVVSHEQHSSTAIMSIQVLPGSSYEPECEKIKPQQFTILLQSCFIRTLRTLLFVKNVSGLHQCMRKCETNIVLRTLFVVDTYSKECIKVGATPRWSTGAYSCRGGKRVVCVCVLSSHLFLTLLYSCTALSKDSCLSA